MSKKKKQKAPSLVSVDLVQLKFRVPKPVKERFDYEADSLHKSQNGYFLALWDMHMELYLKLLTQLEMDARAKIKKEKS